MMQLYQGTKEKWDAFVAANAEDGGVLQSWEWGELEKADGHRVWRLAFENSGELVAACLLVERKLSSLPAGPRQRRWPLEWKYFYAPRGPVLKFPISPATFIPSSRRAGSRLGGDNFQFSNIVSELGKFAREQGAVFLRIEPPYQQFPISNFQFPIRSVKSVQPKQTLRVDLTQSEDELLKAMNQKTRYNIGLAERRGVHVEEKSDVETFFKLLQTTTMRDGFYMHPRVHYEAILSTLGAKLFFASYNGQPLATALVAFFGKTAYYLHGASANEHRDVMAPYALHWGIMREAKRRGCITYDLWGVDEKRWPGVTRFKQGFALNTPFTTYAGTYDFPISRTQYMLYHLRKLFF